MQLKKKIDDETEGRREEVKEKRNRKRRLIKGKEKEEKPAVEKIP